MSVTLAEVKAALPAEERDAAQRAYQDAMAAFFDALCDLPDDVPWMDGEPDKPTNGS